MSSNLITGTKLCSRCGMVKSTTDFQPRSDGTLSTHCKGCRKLYRSKATGYYRLNKWKRKLGISHEEFNNLLAAQHGCCLICGEANKLLYLDHNHETNKFRGFLCHRCNTGLGGFRDSPELMLKAIKYLKEHGAVG